MTSPVANCTATSCWRPGKQMVDHTLTGGEESGSDTLAGGRSMASEDLLHGGDQRSIQDHLVLRELTQRLADVSERIRGQTNRLGDLDLASQDVLIEVGRELEKQQWMLRVQLNGPA
jgi:DNA-binding ferritin-like protein